MSPIKIVYEFELGVKEQVVYICNKETNDVKQVHVEFAKIPETLITAWLNYNAEAIHLYGPEDTMAGIAEYIKDLSKMEYAVQDISIEIN